MYQNINFINFILEFLKITKKDPISKKNLDIESLKVFILMPLK